MRKRNKQQTTSREAYVLRESLKYAVPKADGETPRDKDVFCMALCRRIHTLLGDPRRCREPICRRTQRCAGPSMRCLSDFPAPELTPEQDAEAKADFRRELDREIARRAAGGR